MNRRWQSFSIFVARRLWSPEQVGTLVARLARALAEAGARVVVTSRELSRAIAVAGSLPAVDAGEHLGVEIDQLDDNSIEQAFDRAVESAGRLDILVNNGHDPTDVDLTTVSGEQFTRQLANATGYFLLSRKMHDHVVGRDGRGSIIMLGSMYGLVSSYPDVYQGLGPANPVAYQCLKGGIIQLTRHLAVYWAKDNVRVNCISPGPFPATKQSSELVQRLASRVPVGRNRAASRAQRRRRISGQRGEQLHDGSQFGRRWRMDGLVGQSHAAKHTHFRLAANRHRLVGDAGSCH